MLLLLAAALLLCVGGGMKWHEVERRLENGQDVSLTGNVAADREICVQGEARLEGNGFTIQATDSGFRFFNVVGSLKVADVTLKGSTSAREEHGGAMLVHGEVYATRVTFSGCRARRGNGGAACVKGSLACERCRFEYNQADHNGGAIDARGSVVLRGCEFVENVAFEGRGGAARVAESGSLDAESCVFHLNSAEEKDAGALDTAGATRAANCDFVENEAKASGGAIASSGALALDGCAFRGNRCRKKHGGALVVSAPLTIRLCRFAENRAELNGGAIYCPSDAVVQECEFEGNQADAAGAIFVQGALVATESKFTENTAADGGALVVDDDAQVTVAECSFDKNWADKHSGGAANVRGTLGVTGATFDSNVAADCGGALLVDGAANLKACDFGDNVARSGGAVFQSEEDSAVACVDCYFASNQATTGSGGAFLQDGGVSTCTRCEFAGNTAATTGGGLAFEGDFATLNLAIFHVNSPNDIFAPSGDHHTFDGMLTGSIVGDANFDAPPAVVSNAAITFLDADAHPSRAHTSLIPSAGYTPESPLGDDEQPRGAPSHPPWWLSLVKFLLHRHQL